MHKRTAVVVLLVALVAAVVWWRGRTEDPETQIRAMLRAVVEAAEARSLGGILEHVSRDFRGQGMDRDQLKGLLFVELRRGDWRKVVLVKTQIAVAENQRNAHVETEAVMAEGDKIESLGDLLPTSADRYRFELEVEVEEDEKWRVKSASYAPVRGGG